MLRILCVDDNEDTCELISLMLRMEDTSYQVETAGNAARAMELAFAQPYDLYLLDLWMPDIDGLELCRWIKERNPATPVVFFSASGAERDKRLGLDSGADEYLLKPNDFERLTQVVRTLISRPTDGVPSAAVMERTGSETAGSSKIDKSR